jgi:hypothetical protein
MNSTQCDSTAMAVKLFPRLAMTNPPKKSVKNPRLASPSRRAQSANDGDADQVQVRARLFRMIVENEQTRRTQQRPNAS